MSQVPLERNTFKHVSMITRFEIRSYLFARYFLYACIDVDPEHQSVSLSLKVGENVVKVSNSLDLDETPSYSASHPDPSCLHMGLWL